MLIFLTGDAMTLPSMTSSICGAMRHLTLLSTQYRMSLDCSARASEVRAKSTACMPAFSLRYAMLLSSLK